MVRYPLTEVCNIWAFLTSTGPVGPFELIISWIPVLVGEMLVPPPIRTGELNLGDLMEVLPYRGVFQSLSVWFKSPGVRKTRVPLRAMSVAVTLEAGVWCACVVHLPAATPSGIRGSISGMAIGRVRLINDFCGDFLLVVSLSVTFLFFLSLV